VTRAVAIVAVTCAVVVACATQIRSPQQAIMQGSTDPASVAAGATFPPGRVGRVIAYGHDLIGQTQTYLPHNIGVRMSCAACHPNAGRTPRQGSLLGIYAMFPQWNKRAGRVIALQDRIAECFLYSMNGRPPSYYSKEMVAITAYIAFLSRGAKVGTGFEGQESPKLVAGPPDLTDGASIYRAKCISCHQANGAGMGEDPPLWGPTSFNDKAGMSRMDRIAPFIRVAMPRNAPGTLTDQQAVDVAAFILSHPRPHFEKSKLIGFPTEKASYF
jgi:thiosulfate dehydrogenase